MIKPTLSARFLFQPHSGYTDGMEARYIITFDPFIEMYCCRWESLVEIDGERHILHASAYIPRGDKHDEWLEIHNPLAIAELEKAYFDYLKNKALKQINEKWDDDCMKIGLK